MRSSAGVGGLTGTELALGLITAVLLARALGVEGLGTYSLAMATVVLAGLPVEFGLPSLVMREIAHHGANGDTGPVKGVLIFAATVIALMSTVIILLAFYFGGSKFLGLEGAERAMLTVAVGLIPLSALGKTIGAALAGKHMVVVGLLPQKLVRPGVFAIALAVVSVLEPGWLTPVRAMGLQVAATAAALAFGAFHFLRQFSAALRRSPVRIMWREWSIATLRLGISTGIHLAQGQILLLLTGVLTGAGNAGLFRIAQRGAGLVSLGVVIAITVASPEVARLNAEGRHDQLQRLLTTAARAGSGIALIGLVCFIFGGQWLLDTIFGAEFVAAWSALIILAATETTRALLGPGIMLMNMSRHEGITAIGFIISLCVSTVIAAALIPAYGADGAAWGVFFGVTGMSVFLWQKARQTLRLDPAVIGLPIRHRV